tara:strand:- start:441 stop:683 length:243 start_codon:yes stop_codon:yes gene_type:complete
MFELLAELFSRTLKKYKSSEVKKEKKVLFFQSLFWIVCAFISLILYIPRELSVQEVFIAVVVFIFTIYSAIRALKYFKIL